jgi:hypothetical protein
MNQVTDNGHTYTFTVTGVSQTTITGNAASQPAVTAMCGGAARNGTVADAQGRVYNVQLPALHTTPAGLAVTFNRH